MGNPFSLAPANDLIEFHTADDKSLTAAAYHYLAKVIT